MDKIIRGAKVVFPCHSEYTDVLIRGGKIAAFGTRFGIEQAEVIDGHGKILTPGFIDMHVHGGDDCLFGDGVEESWIKVMKMHARHGTTTILPTISAASKEINYTSMDIFQKLKDRPRERTLPEMHGIHFEGPYFSGAERGAQNASMIRLPDPAEYLEMLEYSPYIKKWAAACEVPGALDFGREISRRGIIASIGHSDADFTQVQNAVEAGYSCITHFYSGCSSLRREHAWRRAGVVEAGYYFDSLWVEVIADGCHLPSPFLKLIYKLKGPENICLITDAIRAAGVENAEERYKFGSKKDHSGFIVEQGVAFLPDRSVFAGSIATSDRLVRTMVTKADVPICDAVRMASLTPAEKLGIAGTKGSIALGKDADLVLLNEQLFTEQVFILGETII